MPACGSKIAFRIVGSELPRGPYKRNVYFCNKECHYTHKSGNSQISAGQLMFCCCQVSNLFLYKFPVRFMLNADISI